MHRCVISLAYVSVRSLNNIRKFLFSSTYSWLQKDVAYCLSQHLISDSRRAVCLVSFGKTTGGALTGVIRPLCIILSEGRKQKLILQSKIFNLLTYMFQRTQLP